jgi:hypothetical protein
MPANRFPPRSSSTADLGAPSDFGSAATPALDDDADDVSSSGKVTPEAVHYHQGEQRCDQCQHFGSGGQCAVLNMRVAPEDGCNAFRSGDGADDSDMDEQDTGYGEAEPADTEDYGL